MATSFILQLIVPLGLLPLVVTFIVLALSQVKEKPIEDLLHNPEIAENMGKQGRKWIKNNFTWEICGENLEKNLNKIIKVYSTEKLGLLPE